jgi:hypothetical protein
MPTKAKTASATAEAATPPAPPAPGVSYRVLPKGVGLVHSGEFDPVSGASLTFERGRVVDGADPAIAAQLEDRGLVEVLGPA